MRDRNGQTTENLIRIPTEVARVVLGHASADVRNELKTCWENRDLYRREDGLVPVDALYGMLDRGRLADQVRGEATAKIADAEVRSRLEESQRAALGK